MLINQKNIIIIKKKQCIFRILKYEWINVSDLNVKTIILLDKIGSIHFDLLYWDNHLNEAHFVK